MLQLVTAVGALLGTSISLLAGGISKNQLILKFVLNKKIVITVLFFVNR